MHGTTVTRLMSIISKLQHTVDKRNIIKKQQCAVKVVSQYVSSGPYIARGQRGQLPPPGKLSLFLTSH